VKKTAVNRGEGSRVTHIAERSTLRVLGAVAHAIDKATSVWIKDLPITPEKILNAVRAKRATKRPVPV